MITLAYRGGENFARGEFRGENFAVKKGGEIFPWRNFGVTVPSFTTAAGIVFPEQGQARLRTRLCQPFAAQMHESDDQVSGVGAAGFFFKASTILNGDVEAAMEGLPLSSASSGHCHCHCYSNCHCYCPCHCHFCVMLTHH